MDHKQFDYVIEHHGVKGMKWGVRRALTATGHIVGSTAKGAAKGVSTAAKATGKAAASAGRATGRAATVVGKTAAKGATKASDSVKMRAKASAEAAALKKERGKGLEKKLRDPRKIKKMSEEEIKQYTDRLNLENNLKRLSDLSSGRDKSKSQYKNRVYLSDQKIRDINSRLQMEENLKQQLSTARKNNNSLELGKHATSIIANTSVSLLKKQLNKEKGTKVLAGDVIFEALKANAKVETTQTIKSANAPKYKKEFMGIVNDEVWKAIDKRTTTDDSVVVDKYSKKDDD